MEGGRVEDLRLKVEDRGSGTDGGGCKLIKKNLPL
jgi:hypothetical protein